MRLRGIEHAQRKICLFCSYKKMATVVVMCSLLSAALFTAATSVTWRCLSRVKHVAMLKICGPCFGRKCCGVVEDENTCCSICLCKILASGPMQCGVCTAMFHRECIEAWRVSTYIQLNASNRIGSDVVQCPACRVALRLSKRSLYERLYGR
jgi:hypothetical protein